MGFNKSVQDMGKDRHVSGVCTSSANCVLNANTNSANNNVGTNNKTINK